jgi:hypothetical protein
LPAHSYLYGHDRCFTRFRERIAANVYADPAPKTFVKAQLSFTQGPVPFGGRAFDAFVDSVKTDWPALLPVARFPIDCTKVIAGGS